MAEDTLRLTPRQARALINGALVGAGTTPDNAAYFTDAILDTELSGLSGHGFYWLQYYCEHLKSGKVDGKAKPKVTRLSPVAFRVDVNRGFAHPAIDKGFEKLIPAAKKYGIAGLALHASYNAATLGFHTGYLAKHGLLAFGFTNASANIAPPGGNAIQGLRPMLSSLLHHVGASRRELLRVRSQALHDPPLSGFDPRTQFLHVIGTRLPAWTTSPPLPLRSLPAAAGLFGTGRRLFLTRGGRIRCGVHRCIQTRQTDHDTTPEHHRCRLSWIPSRHTVLLLCW